MLPIPDANETSEQNVTSTLTMTSRLGFQGKSFEYMRTSGSNIDANTDSSGERGIYVERHDFPLRTSRRPVRRLLHFGAQQTRSFAARAAVSGDLFKDEHYPEQLRHIWISDGEPVLQAEDEVANNEENGVVCLKSQDYVLKSDSGVYPRRSGVVRGVAGRRESEMRSLAWSSSTVPLVSSGRSGEAIPALLSRLAGNAWSIPLCGLILYCSLHRFGGNGALPITVPHPWLFIRRGYDFQKWAGSCYFLVERSV